MNNGNVKIYGIIYKITNKINNKVYIGQTTNKRGFKGRYHIGKNSISLIEGVYKYHLTIKNSGKKYNVHLFNSIEKYGYNSFEVCEFLDVAFSKKELDIKERSYISIYKSINQEFGYNNQEGGSYGKNSNESINKSKKTMIETGKTRSVYQLSFPDLKIIKEFPCISDASNQLKLSRSHIKNVLSPKCNNLTAGGYAWSYTNEQNLKYKFNKKTKKEITIELYKNGNNIEEISNTIKSNKCYVTKILQEENLLENLKPIILNNAKIKRKNILNLYLKGKSNSEIQKETGLSKSIVEKAIDKYIKGIIDLQGNYIKEGEVK